MSTAPPASPTPPTTSDGQAANASAAEADAKIRLEFSASFSSELTARMRRLDGLVGERHWLSVGTYKEQLLGSMLRHHVPGRYEIGTGFVTAVSQGERVLSKQIDLLIWDSQDHAPVFRDGPFVIVPPEACVAAIEVKSTLTYDALKEAVDNLHSLDRFLDFVRPNSVCHKAIFAYQASDKPTYPDGILRNLFNYSHSFIASRLSWSRLHHGLEKMPWIDTIAILGRGVISQAGWDADGDAVPTYVALDTQYGELDNTFGYFAATLHTDLATGGRRSGLRFSHPGKASMADPLPLDRIVAFLAMRATPRKTKRIGGVGDSDLAYILDREIVPKAPGS